MPKLIPIVTTMVDLEAALEDTVEAMEEAMEVMEAMEVTEALAVREVDLDSDSAVKNNLTCYLIPELSSK
jgi:hypothetical protein